MMIVHIATLVFLFADPASQTPVVVQCVSPAPEPWWKWFVPLFQSVIPVAGGVWIALWSFRATSAKEHQRWIIDQKKGEWKELLNMVSEIEYAVPNAVRREEGERAVEEKLQAAVRQLLACRASRLFTATFWEKREHDSHFVELVTTLDKGAQTMESLTAELLNLHENDIPSKLTFLHRQEETYRELRGAYFSLRDWLAESARKDLNIRETETSKVSSRK